MNNLSNFEIELINSALNQNFKYLNESSRVSVYSSEDNKFVIKLLKSAPEINAKFQSWGMDLGKVDWSFKPGDALASAEIMGKESIKSYQLAYNKLKDQTALIYIQLVETNFLPNEIMIGGTKYNANKIQFILQHKVQLFGERLDQLMNATRVDDAKKEIDNLLDYIISLWKTGISEDTYNFHDNYGFFNDRIVQIDIGEFHDRLDIVKKQIEKKLILEKTSFDWLKRRHPNLATYLTSQVKQRFTIQGILG